MTPSPGSAASVSGRSLVDGGVLNTLTGEFAYQSNSFTNQT